MVFADLKHNGRLCWCPHKPCDPLYTPGNLVNIWQLGLTPEIILALCSIRTWPGPSWTVVLDHMVRLTIFIRVISHNFPTLNFFKTLTGTYHNHTLYLYILEMARLGPARGPKRAGPGRA